MPAFLVRHTGDKQLVGIFAALSSDELANMVDECTSGTCEFVLLPAGGILWTSATVTIPVPALDRDNVPSLPWADAGLSDSWFDVFYSSDANWLPVDYLGRQKASPRGEH
jgi:hypothetical protein